MSELNRNIIYALVIGALLLSAGTAYYHQAEGWSYVDSFYFSTMTLTTIGYGDLVPTTDTSKIVTSIYSIVGIGIILYLATSIALSYINKRGGRLYRFATRLHGVGVRFRKKRKR